MAERELDADQVFRPRDACESDHLEAVIQAVEAARDDGDQTWVMQDGERVAVIAPAEAAGQDHLHRWQILQVREVVLPALFATFGPAPTRTVVLGRCATCGQPFSWVLSGTWTLEDFTAPGPPP